ncbi:hypothetical protein COCON_G00056230 [Conger conger]|uniref:POPDC1-3 domain-containing protein n=1 Tax=Conger conger TaxID=82655 RepID=A0A9Q1DWZ0_CONCO|nr:hypothetical protein COCON_G00056230 [Conger conger]
MSGDQESQRCMHHREGRRELHGPHRGAQGMYAVARVQYLNAFGPENFSVWYSASLGLKGSSINAAPVLPVVPALRRAGELYRALFRPLGATPAEFSPVVEASGTRVWTLHEGDAYALEQATPIDQLSLLLSGRVRVSLDGQFVQYIFPFQFLDSPEWEALQPTDEGTFQDRYLGRIFAVLLGNDIADKLYALNERLFIKHGLILDIRLPGLYFSLEGREPAPGPPRPWPLPWPLPPPGPPPPLAPPRPCAWPPPAPAPPPLADRRDHANSPSPPGP